MIEILLFGVNILASWQPSPDAARYVASWGFAPYVYEGHAEAVGASLAMAGMPEGRTLYFVVQAKNTAGLVSVPTEQISIVLGAGGSPTPTATPVPTATATPPTPTQTKTPKPTPVMKLECTTPEGKPWACKRVSAGKYNCNAIN